MNEFEKFLKANKDKLDDEQVKPELWLSIENQVLKRKNARLKFIYKSVASVAATIIVGLLAFTYLYKPKPDVQTLLAQNGILSDQFESQLEVRTKSLASSQIPVAQKSDFDLLLKQIEMLDAQYLGYLDILESEGYQELIGIQIKNYYNTKISLLDQIKEEIQKIDYYEKKYNKSSSKTELKI